MSNLFLWLLCFPTGLSPVGEDEKAPDVKAICRDVKIEGVRESYLLASSAIVDDRPLYVENALIVAKSKDGKWWLVKAYRHPKEKTKNSDQWHLSVVFDADQSPLEEYDHKPTSQEVDAFLKHSWWKFEPENGFRLVHGKVHEQTWEKALGYKPEYMFPKP